MCVCQTSRPRFLIVSLVKKDVAKPRMVQAVGMVVRVVSGLGSRA